MRRWTLGLVALVVVTAGLLTPATPVAAAREDPPVEVSQSNSCTDPSSTCTNEAGITGTGESITILMQNACGGLGTFCSNTVTLAGDYDVVVVKWGNECTAGTRCFNAVIVQGSIRKIFKRGRDRCAKTAICENTRSR